MPMARDAYDPTSGVLGGMQLAEQLTQGQLSEQTRLQNELNQRINARMREQLSAAQPEDIFGADAADAPILKRMMAAQLGPEAVTLGNTLLGPQIAGRKAADVATAQQNAIYNNAIKHGINPFTGEPLSVSPMPAGAAPRSAPVNPPAEIATAAEPPAALAPEAGIMPYKPQAAVAAAAESPIAQPAPTPVGPQKLPPARKRVWDSKTGTAKFETTTDPVGQGKYELDYEKGQREITSAKQKEMDDIEARIDKLVTKKREAPTSQQAAIQNEIDYNMGRLAKKQKEAGIEPYDPKAPKTARIAATATAASRPGATPKVIGDVDISGLPAPAQEKILGAQAEAGIRGQEAALLDANRELVEARKTQKPFANIDDAITELETINIKPKYDKSRTFVEDIDSDVLTGPFGGRLPSGTAKGVRADQLMAKLSFEAMPKGMGQMLNSEGERAMWEKAQMSSTNDKLTNYNAAQSARSRGINARDYPLFIERWVTKNKTRAGAQEAWETYVENNSNYVLDPGTGIAQKNAQRVPSHVYEKGDTAVIKYLDNHLKVGKVYPTPQGRMYYTGGGTFLTPDEFAGAKR